ncbi:thioredoxin family protein [Niastella caeni]|uniref:Thioredoxin family protein n=1 Tax=Niastella caeni TaxID=2569763 RepID=A0A4S8HVF5_9BACT|nr:DUF255 domain-containing protein [Niastella caeni]THU39607.1 thioredoxin family protein [Niastella caeni]
MNNIKMHLCLVVVCLPLLLQAQDEKGIKWATGLSWEQVKEKAKRDNKYIFLDCYATWCGPCKMMDREIYPLKVIGDLYNGKFISIKVQFDRTEKDDRNTRNWYQDAEKILTTYKVTAYPTFLFVTPMGELVHRASGGMNGEKMLAMANDALEQKGYASLIKRFNNGQYENLNLKELAVSAKYAGEDSVSKEIATVYLKSLSAQDLINQDNLPFILGFAEKDKRWAQQVCMPKIKQLSLPQLANPRAIRFLLNVLKNDSLSRKASDYWLNDMKDNQVFNRDTLDCLKAFVRNSTDKSFVLLFKNAERVDKIMGKKNWTVDALSHVIIKEEFLVPTYYPAVKTIKDNTAGIKLTDPDWKKLNATVAFKYGTKYASWLQFTPKIIWYNLIGNKKEYTKYLVSEMERTAGWELHGLVLNNYCMEVFRYSISKTELRKAAAWMKRYYSKNPKEMRTDASGLDTYAILLYKAGHIKESLKLEQKAAKIDPNNNEIANNLSKMKKGLPIWPVGFDVVN